jgi:hypothetical protein
LPGVVADGASSVGHCEDSVQHARSREPRCRAQGAVHRAQGTERRAQGTGTEHGHRAQGHPLLPQSAPRKVNQSGRVRALD